MSDDNSKPPRPPRDRDGEKRPFRPRGEGGRGDRGPRKFGGSRDGDRPRGDRGSDRGGDRGDRKPYAGRGEGGDRKPYAGRGERGDRKPYSGRGERDDRKPYSGRGERDDRKPYAGRSEGGERKPYGTRGASGDRPHRPWQSRDGDRPPRRDGDGERSGRSWTPRPPREGGDDRPRGGFGAPRGRRDEGGERRPYRDREDRGGGDRGGSERRFDRGEGRDFDRGPRREETAGDRPDIWRNKPRSGPGGRYGAPRNEAGDAGRHGTDRTSDAAPRRYEDHGEGVGTADAPHERTRDRTVAGLPAVAALFALRGESVLRLFYDDAMKGAAGPYCAELAKARKPYRLVDDGELTRIAGSAVHGGIVAVAETRPVPGLMIAEARAWAARGEPLIILDGVGNPHNLGAIARTAAFFGYKRIVLSGHAEQALPSDAAYRVAKGGMEHVDFYRAPGIAETLAELREHFRPVATGIGEGVPVGALAADPRPVALVLGNEEEGLPEATKAACEATVTIAGSGRVQSLNVAATAAILLQALASAGSA